MALNAARAGIEDALEQREVELAAAAEDDLEPIRPDAARRVRPLGQPAPDHPAPTPDRGRVPRAWATMVYDGREVETVQLQLRRAQFRRKRTRPGTRATRSTSTSRRLLRTQTSPSQIQAMQAEAAADLPGLARPHLPSRHDRRHALRPIFHQVEGLAVDRGITLADLRGNAPARHRTPSSARTRRAVADALLPLHRAVGGARHLVLPSATARAARSASTRAGSRWAAPASSTRTSSRRSARPRGVEGFAFGLGIERIASCATGRPTCGPSGRTTCAS